MQHVQTSYLIVFLCQLVSSIRALCGKNILEVSYGRSAYGIPCLRSFFEIAKKQMCIAENNVVSGVIYSDLDLVVHRVPA